MKSITVAASKTYRVIIDSDLLTSVGSYAVQVTAPCKCVIISDSNVWPLYGKAVQDSLTHAGFQVLSFVFSAGEASKTGETYLSILNYLAENKITRSDLIVALGGGVVGDMAGFVAATYLRGIRYIQLPTTLLAMVDSSVGGKTAIDLPAGKNLAGAFYQPSLVLCDITALDTLPETIFTDGSAEVIKYGVLFDRDLFQHLEKQGSRFHKEKVISRCVELKRDIVADDEFDTGVRQKLNLGHTIGHAIEKQSEFTVSHGRAVAAGMAIVARAASSMQVCSLDTATRICALLKKFDLPVETAFTAEQLLDSALSDKKRSGGRINLILPEEIGSCRIQSIPVNELQIFIKAGL